MVDKPCSPYEEILPLGANLRASLVGEKEDKIWKVSLAPGTDNSFHQGNITPVCFGETQKIEYLRELDRMLCRDSGVFAIKLKVTTRENIGGFKSLASLLLWLKFLSGSLGRAEFDRLWAKWNRSEQVKISNWVDLNTVTQIYLTTGVKAIDRVLFSLYTGTRSSAKTQTDSWLYAKPMSWNIGGCSGTWALRGSYNCLGYNEGEYW